MSAATIKSAAAPIAIHQRRSNLRRGAAEAGVCTRGFRLVSGILAFAIALRQSADAARLREPPQPPEKPGKWPEIARLDSIPGRRCRLNLPHSARPSGACSDSCARTSSSLIASFVLAIGSQIAGLAIPWLTG